VSAGQRNFEFGQGDPPHTPYSLYRGARSCAENFMKGSAGAETRRRI
jgi:hypothetical protein